MNIYNKNTNIKKLVKLSRQKGFTLVTVLILSSLASILVLTSLKDNITQERLSGNYQKKINARLASERGVSESRQLGITFLDANPDLTDGNQLEQVMAVANGGGALDTTHNVVANYDETTNIITLTSTGNRYEARNTVRARFQFTAASSGSAFENAVVGCDGVNLSGSGQVDSYNSSITGYDSFNPGTEGNVSTISQNADVFLKGNSPIFGIVQATGRISLGGSSPVHGTLHANRDIYINQGDVRGNVLTRGNFEVVGSTIRGHVRVNGTTIIDENGHKVHVGTILRDSSGKPILDSKGVAKRDEFNVKMGQGAKISNLAQDKEDNKDIPLAGLAIIYGGKGDFKDLNNNKEYEKTKYQGSPNVAKVKQASSDEPTNPTTNCDHLDIVTVVNKVQNGATGLPDFLSENQSKKYSLTPNALTGEMNGTSVVFNSTTEDVLGKPTLVIKLGSFHLRDELTVSGTNSTLYVDGDFTLSSIARIQIEDGSSLTLIVTGVVNINAEGIFAERHGLTNPTDPTSLPAMSIYSSYYSDSDDDAGVIIAGASKVYAQIYAPLAIVKLSGSGEVFGAIRGRKVDVPGDTKIHYDAALGKANRGSSYSSEARIEFLGMTY